MLRGENSGNWRSRWGRSSLSAPPGIAAATLDYSFVHSDPFLLPSLATPQIARERREEVLVAQSASWIRREEVDDRIREALDRPASLY